MSLVSNVQSRYGDQYLVNLTNPGDNTATTIDSTRLALAATDVEANFEIFAGVEYDDTDPQHVTVGVEGVEVLLKFRAGHTTVEEWSDWIEKRLKPMSLVGARDRIMPTTNSEVTPTSESDTGDGRPYFDSRRFRYLIPGRPATGEDPDLD